MRDVAGQLRELAKGGARGAKDSFAAGLAIARVVGAKGSYPRGPGATMVVSEEGTVVGSLSGGCVEGAVVEEALGVIAGGPARLLSFGYSDDEALSVGLTCGGILDIFVAPGISDAISAA